VQRPEDEAGVLKPEAEVDLDDRIENAKAENLKK
jgi:hypothetical protein